MEGGSCKLWFIFGQKNPIFVAQGHLQMVGICKSSTELDRKFFFANEKNMNAHEIFLNKQIRILLLTVQVATVANIYFEYWRFIWRYALFTTCCFERIFAMCVKWSWKRCAQFPAHLIFSCSIWSQNDKTVARIGNIANCTCVTLVGQCFQCVRSNLQCFQPVRQFAKSYHLKCLTQEMKKLEEHI